MWGSPAHHTFSFIRTRSYIIKRCTLPLQCSASCGAGIQKRELKCGEKSIHGKLITFPQRRCRNIKKPNINLEEACTKGACPSQTLYNMVAGWYSSPWQQVGMGNCLASLSLSWLALLLQHYFMPCFYGVYKRSKFLYTVVQVPSPSAFHHTALTNGTPAMQLLSPGQCIRHTYKVRLQLRYRMPQNERSLERHKHLVGIKCPCDWQCQFRY